MAGRESDGEKAETPSTGSLEEVEGLLGSEYGDDEREGEEWLKRRFWGSPKEHERKHNCFPYFFLSYPFQILIFGIPFIVYIVYQ